MGIKIILLLLIITHAVLLIFLRNCYSRKRITIRSSLIMISSNQRRDYISKSIKLPELLSGKYAKGI